MAVSQVPASRGAISECFLVARRLRKSALPSRGFSGGFPGYAFAPPDLLLRIHGPAALCRAAVADGFLIVAVIQAIVVGDLVARGDVANRRNPDAAIGLFGFAVGIAAVIDKHGRAVAVDDDRAVAESKQVGDGRILVGDIGLVFGDTRTIVLGHTGAFTHGCGGVAACSVDRG